MKRFLRPTPNTKELQSLKLDVPILRHTLFTADNLETRNLIAMICEWNIHESIENLFHQLKDNKELVAKADPIRKSTATCVSAKALKSLSRLQRDILLVPHNTGFY